MSLVSVRDMMDYLGFAVSYDDDQDWYDSVATFCRILDIRVYFAD